MQILYIPQSIYANPQVLKTWTQHLRPLKTWNMLFRACLHGGGGPQAGEVTRGRSPHLSCKCDQIDMSDYMDGRVTPPTWATYLGFPTSI